MAFNPLANFIQGQQAGQAMQDRRTEADEKRLRGLAAQLGEQSEAYKELMVKNPEAAMTLKQTFSTDNGGVAALIDDSMSILYHLESDPSGASAREVIVSGIKNVPKFGGRNTKHRENLLNILDTQGVDALKANLSNVHKVMADVKDGGKNKAGTQETFFNSLLEAAKNDPNGETLEGKAALVKLNLVAKTSTSAAERIATDPELAQQIAATEKVKAVAKEEGRSTAQLKYKPQIQAAVKIAEAEATSRGESLNNLNRMEASLPGLQDAVSDLRELSAISTSTLGGRLFDIAVQETGFGATKGGTARAKLIAIVSNQVLPLLKETFGAAFTVDEAKELKATMGDPNATHESRMAQLDAFIAQKVRSIQGVKSELGMSQAEMDELAELEAQFGGQ